MTAGSLPARMLVVLLAAGCVALPCLALAVPAWAEEDGAEARPADDATARPKPLSSERLDALLKSSPLVQVTFTVVKFLPVAIGVGLLIAWYLKQDRIRGGMLPAPAPAEPTLVLPAGMAVLLVLAAFGIGPAAFSALFAGGTDREALQQLPRWLAILAMVLPTLALAVAVVVMRRRVQRLGPADFEARYGERGRRPSEPPRLGRGFGLGWWTYCVASVLVLPVMLLWALVLVNFGQEPTVQDTVRIVVEDRDPSIPIFIVVFGVFVAPFTEECAFRGLLYPAIKHGLGGGVKAARWGIVLTSAIFAGIHGNLLAALPLFALALVLNWVFERTNSLAAVVVAHAVHNALSLVPLLLLRYSS